jgi:hypothetical protein
VMLRCGGDLHCGHCKQSRANECQYYFSHFKSPLFRCEAKVMQGIPLSPRPILYLTLEHRNYQRPGSHEAASKFIGQGRFSAKYSACGPGRWLLLQAKQLYRLP